MEQSRLGRSKELLAGQQPDLPQDGRFAGTELINGELNLTVDVYTPVAPITLKTGIKAKRSVYDFGNERVAHQ